MALVETLLAAPIVMLLGLGALQSALLMHARTAVEYAVFEAARAGSVGQARIDAIEDGLARGLAPFWQTGGAAPGTPAALAAARSQLAAGLTARWIDWRQLSPTAESFADWAEPARDGLGRSIAGTAEIPNDSLQWASLRAPAGGPAAMRGSEPVGARSRQTLNDANLLKLELRYGVPMAVPLVGRVAVWIMRIVDGCAAPAARRIGLVDLGAPATSPDARAWTCAFYLAPDHAGRPVPRWPVRASATVRMQSAARLTSRTPGRSGAGTPGATGTVGSAGPLAPVASVEARRSVHAAVEIDAPAPAPVRSVPVPASTDITPRPSGWLRIGGERTFTMPGACS